ncbi:MAG: 50S ribosomal protein L11 methyltransferase, partial [Solirubrobacteraceae bacterium]
MLRLAVRVHRRQAELVLAELLELAPSGVEEVEISADVIEYAVYGAPGELPAVPDLRAAAGGAYVDVSTEEIADDWAERWRSF